MFREFETSAFRGMAPRERNEAIIKYYDQVLAPTVPVEEQPVARKAFLQQATPYLSGEFYALEPSIRQAPPRWKEVTSEIGHMTLPSIGMMVGGTPGVLGSPLTAGTSLPLAMTGGALGYGGGEQLAKGIDQLLGLRSPRGFGEQLMNAGKDIGHGAMYEMGGRAVAPYLAQGIQRVAAPVAKSMNRAALERSQLSENLNIPLRPAEITQSPMLDRLERFLQGALGSSSVMAKDADAQLGSLRGAAEQVQGRGAIPESLESLGGMVQEKAGGRQAAAEKGRQKAVGRLTDETVGRFGTKRSAEEVGDLAQTAGVERSKQARARASAPFNALKEQLPEGTTVKTDTVEAALREAADDPDMPPGSIGQLRRFLGMVEDTPQITQLREAMNRMPEGHPSRASVARALDEAGAPPRTWEQVQKTRTKLDELVRRENPAWATKNPGLQGQITGRGRVYLNLRRALDADIQKFSDDMGGTFKGEYESARAGWRAFKQRYTNKDFLSVMNKNASQVSESVFQSGNVERVRAFRDGVGHEAFDQVARRFVTDLIGDGSPQAIDKAIKKYGEDVLREGLGKDRLLTLKAISRRAKKLDELPVSDPVLRDILRVRPEQVFDTIIRRGTKPTRERVEAENLKRLGSVLPIIGESGKKRLAAKALERIFAENKHGVLSPNDILTMQQAYGEKTLEALFPKKALQEIVGIGKLSNELVRAGQRAANPSGTAASLITFLTPLQFIREALSLDVAGAAKTAFGAVGAPTVMAKVYLSPAGRKWLTVGLRLPKDSPERIKAMGQLATIIGAEATNDDETGTAR